METDTFGNIVVWTIYISHTDHFTPQHTAFERSVACLSVDLEFYSVNNIVAYWVNFK